MLTNCPLVKLALLVLIISNVHARLFLTDAEETEIPSARSWDSGYRRSGYSLIRPAGWSTHHRLDIYQGTE